jgi:hypothetical protein
MMFADRQDVGLPRDSRFHCGGWMLASVVVDLIPYTCRAGKTPGLSQSGHGSRVGPVLPKPSLSAATRSLLTWVPGSGALHHHRLEQLVSSIPGRKQRMASLVLLAHVFAAHP